MNFNLSLREIEYVLEVAGAENFTKAAEKLYMSQPSLSQAIIRIENKLGIQIFERGKGKVKMTPDGQRFVKMGRQIMSAAQYFQSEVEGLNSQSAGTLSVGTPPLLGSYLLPSVIREYTKEYPKINLKLREENSQKLEECLIKGEVDIAIVPMAAREPQISYKTLFKSRMVVIMSKDSEYNRFAYDTGEKNKCIDLSDCESAKFIIGNIGQRVRYANEMIFQRAGIIPEIVMHSRNIDTIRHLAGAGVGLAMLPECYICDGVCGCDKISCRHSTRDVANYYYLPEEQDYFWEVAVAHSQGTSLSKAAESFRNKLIDYCEKNRSILETTIACINNCM